jgi:hypothetical protein
MCYVIGKQPKRREIPLYERGKEGDFLDALLGVTKSTHYPINESL